MFSTTTSTTHTNYLSTGRLVLASTLAALSQFGDAILTWAVRVGESSSAAKAADKFARLNGLSDEALADRGLKREDLVDLCFGHLMTY